MTTKRELEKLARRAFGRGTKYKNHSFFGESWAQHKHYLLKVECDDGEERREMLAAALRGIIAWKEGKE